VALLLVSSSFLASEFIKTMELPTLLKRRAQDGLVVIPVILRACSWEHHPAIAPFQVLPRGTEPIAKHTGHRRDLALKQVATAISALANNHVKKAQGTEPAPKLFVLRLVASVDEVRSGIRAFNVEARRASEQARRILRQTTYWVHDLHSDAFGPAKFVGYGGMSLDRYAAARAFRLTGQRFDGHLTRITLERVLGRSFVPSKSAATSLVRWGEALLGAGAFGGADRTKWRFLTV
jgi:hypothetical protein